MLRFTFILLLFISFSLNIFAQKNIAPKEIDEVIKNYFEGYMTGNLEKLAIAFDTTAGSMFATAKDSAIINYKFATLTKRWADNATKKPFTAEEIKSSYYKIQYFDKIDDKLASVKIEIKLGKNLFIDVLTMYKINQKWKITSKLFVKK
ncbi:MAG: hypothetical protein EAZ85_10635 [Bacteroidetes bacterium]|nr:MAG: hypothetical protein EAZ85_10635 [Bacteroidota bacterium]